MQTDSASVAPALLEVRNLRAHFFTDEGVVKSVDGVSFDIPRGKTVCIVGESGCGKSITARSILKLVASPGRIVDGQIIYHGMPGAPVDIVTLPARSAELRAIRGNEIGMIFQEPMTALSPVHTIGDQVSEAILLHRKIGREAAKEQTIRLLDRVGIPRAASRFDAYPFELSGGMRQRACIAMALACGPKLLIADEPTTALDVTTQANILDLIAELQAEMGMAVMFITHDLGVVAEIADEVVVMYLGTIAERADVFSIFNDPQHPYTRALMRSIPRLGQPRKTRLESIRGIVPHPLNRPSGCPYHTRCDRVMPSVCDRIDPRLEDVGGGHLARCLLHSRLEGDAAPHRVGV